MCDLSPRSAVAKEELLTKLSALPKDAHFSLQLNTRPILWEGKYRNQPAVVSRCVVCPPLLCCLSRGESESERSTTSVCMHWQKVCGVGAVLVQVAAASACARCAVSELQSAR